jgi:hypothetical protein
VWLEGSNHFEGVVECIDLLTINVVMKPNSVSSVDIILQDLKSQGRFGLVASRDAEGAEVERPRKSNTP